MWCPHCKTEYRDGFFHCKECGAALASTMPIDPDPALEPVLLFEGEPTYFTTVNDETEFVALRDFLKADGIACLRKHPGSAAYVSLICGKSVQGLEVYVPAHLLENARQVLRSMQDLSELLP